MNTIAALITWSGEGSESATLQSLRDCGNVRQTALVLSPGAPHPPGRETVLRGGSLWSTSSVIDILRWFAKSGSDFLLWVFPGAPIFSPSGLARLVDSARDADAALAYGDYFDLHPDGSATYHPLIDYQPGSLRDDFDFGAVVLLSRDKLTGLTQAMEEPAVDWRYGAWYELRLRLSERGTMLHLSEPIYRKSRTEARTAGERVFDYVDPSRRDYQVEMENVVTDHLRRIGALLPPPQGGPCEDSGRFPVKASVVIPVKNRARTIGEAVRSALSQRTSFDFNVIVVDNHSTDGTTDLLRALAAEDNRLVHIVPERTDLLIGGCWNQAIHSAHCGRFAVQLDSDDLYDGTDVLDRIVRELERGPFALVIGSYTTVNLSLEPLPPGLVDHREWTDSNGHNNALRIAGLGAPRAYHVPTLRSIGFPNVSYGEDYSVVLRLSRSHPVGRIYDSLYWCRRWEENSDSALSLETSNRYAAYKDKLRTIEIAARRKKMDPER